MLKNYLKIAYRNLKKGGLYSFINIIGLSIGLASVLFIYSFVKQEVSYDKFHEDSERIYRVGYEISMGTGTKIIASSPHRLANELETDFPELEKVIHFSRVYGGEVTYEGKKLREEQLAFVDSSFLELFNFPLIQGNPKTALAQPNQVVISKSMVSKYFNGTDPLGKNIKIQEPYGERDMELIVTGVIEDMPTESHFHLDAMISMSTGNSGGFFPNGLETSWGWDSQYTYIKLPKDRNIEDFRADLLGFGKKHIEGQWFIQFFAQPLESIHLNSKLNSEIEANGDSIYVYIFSIVGIVILLLACVNYMNLATAKAINRSKEVSIRKAVGAARSQIVSQFLGESISYSLIALLVGGLLAEVVVNPVNDIFELNIVIDILHNSQLLLLYVGLGLIVGIISGSYPAFYISRFKPSQVFRSSSKSSSGASALRKILVVVQFSLSIALIILSLVIFDQVEFLKNKNLGAITSQNINIPSTTAISSKIDLFKTELLRNQQIESFTTSSRRLGRDINSGNTYQIENNGEQVSANLSNIFVGFNFLEHFNVEIKAGRHFSENIESDAQVILNESALEALGIDNPDEVIGKQIKSWFTATIVGVIKDFHFEPLHNKIKPMVFAVDPTSVSWITVKISPDKMSETIAHIEDTWKTIETNREFRYSFLDDDLQKLYNAEQRFLGVFTLFVSLAVFIACFGLLGVVTYSISQRLKEIGIRKVLGATVIDITTLMSSDFLKLVIFSNIIAYPIAYFAAKNWLQNFEYQTELNWNIFLIATLAALIIAGLTISITTIKGALTNPTTTLKED